MRNHITDSRGRCCPCCGKQLLPDSWFCYDCGVFLSMDLTAPRPPEEVSDLELQALLDRSHRSRDVTEKSRRSRVFNVFSAVTTVLFILSLVLLFRKDRMPQGLAALTLTVLMVLVCTLVMPRTPTDQLSPEQLEQLAARYLVPGLVQELLGPEAFYSPLEAMDEDLLPHYTFSPDTYNHYEGSQQIRGVYRGIPVALGHATITDTRHIGHRMSTVQVFRGYCLAAETCLPIPAEIRVVEKHFGVLKALHEPRAEDLERVFRITSQDPAAPKTVLSPPLRLRLMEVFRCCPGPMGLLLKPGGQIRIAAGEFPDNLEELSSEKLRSLYRKRLTLPLRILDCFLDG